MTKKQEKFAMFGGMFASGAFISSLTLSVVTNNHAHTAQLFIVVSFLLAIALLSLAGNNIIKRTMREI